jgi:hypothetical protein
MRFYLLVDAVVVDAPLKALFLPVRDDVAPALLHPPEDCHVQGLHEVGRIFRQEDEPGQRLKFLCKTINKNTLPVPYLPR